MSVVATDYSNHSQTNNYQVVVTNNGVAETLTYDLNGNLSSEVTATTTNMYQWDAANRLVQITQLSTNNTQLMSQFTYDGFGRRTQIIELQNGLPVSTNLFLWDGQMLAEQRDSTGANVMKRFFGQGEQISGINYYFTKDHLGSIREMMDSNGVVRARYDYDPYGRRTKVSGDLDADFGFCGYFYHVISGLYLTLYRAYDSIIGRWLSRYPMGENGGLDLYIYVENNPANFIDRLGLCDGPPDALDWFNQFLRDHPLEEPSKPWDPFPSGSPLDNLYNDAKNGYNDINNILNHHFGDNLTTSVSPIVDMDWSNFLKNGSMSNLQGGGARVSATLDIGKYLTVGAGGFYNRNGDKNDYGCGISFSLHGQGWGKKTK